MRKCPDCRTFGSIGPTATGLEACSRCGWASDGSALGHPVEIPTWKVLVPLVVPVACLWTGSVLNGRKGAITVPSAEVAIGLAFLLVGLWSAWCGVFWYRLSQRFHGWWRPSFAGTPWLLAVVFVLVGAWLAIAGAAAMGAKP